MENYFRNFVFDERTCILLSFKANGVHVRVGK